MYCKISLLLVLTAMCFGSPTGSSDNQITIMPDRVTKDVGDVAKILCTWKNEPLMQCIFKIPQEGNGYKKISLIDKSPNNDTSITYYGEGMQKGECGVNMIVEEKHHGTITCELTRVRDGHFLEANMTLTVAKKPKKPVLSLDAKTYLEGTNVTASCVVAEGRPAANITWTFEGMEDFNNIIKKQHKRTEEPVGTTTTVTEGGTWTVTADDDQKSVTCIADHDSWKKLGPKVAKQTVTVHYQPRIFNENNQIQNDLLYPNLVLGEAATLLVKLKANPAPTGVEITIGNSTWTIGQDNEEYQISQLEQQNGYHIYSLVIRNLTKEDLHQVCLFNVTNSVGSSVARLTFSIRPPVVPDTKPEKERAVAGNTLIGIIIAVSIIIIITIGVIMFAKFNKKWCFVSKPPVHTGHLVPTE